MNIENERYIKGYEGKYSVTRDGKVISYFNKNKPRVLKTTLNHKGYKMVRLGRKKNKAVHRAVAETWIPNPNNMETVNHKDENKLNNNVENLEWMSRLDNNNYGNHNSNVRNALIMNSHSTPTKVVFDDKNKDPLFFDSFASTTEYLGIGNSTLYRKFKETSENYIRLDRLKVNIYKTNTD